jgi:curved DNA-binding protein CbpA
VLQDFKDYYSRLDITFTATEAEIKAAYRKMARENHPDMHPDESDWYTEQFQEITEAYEVLSDPAKKTTYDFKYRQFVLHEGPQYEYVVDDTPPDTKAYKHKYTYRNKRTFSYASVAALIFLCFQVLRMVINAAPIEDKKPYNRAFQPISVAPVNTNGAYKNESSSSSDSINLPFSNAPFLEKARH